MSRYTLAARFTAICCVVALTALTAPAQKITLTTKTKGSAIFLRLSCSDAPALQVFAKIADALNVTFDLGDPAIAEMLQNKTVTANSIFYAQEDLMDMVGDSIGVIAQVARGDTVMTIRPFPTGDGLKAVELRQDTALRHLMRTVPDQEDTVKRGTFLVTAARLHAISGNLDDALNSLHGFLEEQPDHADAADLALEGTRLALNAKRPVEAQRFLDFFMAEFSNHHRMTEAEILFARSLLARGDTRRARLTLERLTNRSSRGAISHREGLVVELMLAGILLNAGELQKGIELLKEVPVRHPSNRNTDLYNQVPLLRGVLHQRAGQTDQAIYHFQIAVAKGPTTALRIRALLELAEVYLELDRSVQCIAACRMAEELKPSASLQNDILRIRGRGLARLNLGQRAVTELVKALETLTGDKESRQTRSAQIMSEIANVLVGLDDFAAAREIFVRLQSQEAHADHAIYMTALADHHADRHQSALNLLNRLKHVTPGASPRLYSNIRKLRGDSLMASGRFERALRAWNGGQ